METRRLQRFVRFSPEAVQRETVFETPRLWSDVLCLAGNQHTEPMREHGSDAMFTVVAGEAVFLVDGRRKRLEQWGAVLVEAGQEVTVTNASTEPLVLLLVAAPPPPPVEASPLQGADEGAEDGEDLP